MRLIFCALCVAMCAGTAEAQDEPANTPVSNFDKCVGESQERRTEAALENYLSYKCDGLTARKLAARPDQCSTDVRPSLSSIERRSRQYEDGFYLRMIWRTEVCAGMCETRFYNDGREPKYLCEVRRHVVAGRVAQPTRAPDHARRPDEHRPEKRTAYRPLLREYSQPASSRAARRTQRIEAQAAPRRTERRTYPRGPESYVEYENPGADY